MDILYAKKGASKLAGSKKFISFNFLLVVQIELRIKPKIVLLHYILLGFYFLL